MEWLHQFELAWILFVQSISVWLKEPMRLISMVGNEEFFLIVMPILYWSIDSSLGIRVGAILLLGNGLNAALKIAFHGSRPYWLDPAIRAYSAETSFGLPSNHAQTAAGIWGFVATRLRSKPARIGLVLLIFMIGFSRIYLGMHFISDVLVGWLIGGLILLGMARLDRPITAWLSGFSLRGMLGIALLSSLMLGGLVLLSSAATQSWQIPPEWEQNALLAHPETPINPLSLDPAFTSAGTWLGLWAGVAWYYHRRGGYTANGTVFQRLVRYLIGLAGVFVLWFVLGKVFPREADLVSYLLRFLRYFLIGGWMTGLAPMLFEKLGLSNISERKYVSLTR